MLLTILAGCTPSGNTKPDSDSDKTPDDTPNDKVEDPDNNVEEPGGTDDPADTEPLDDFYTLEPKSESRTESSIPSFTEKQIKNQKIKGASIIGQINEAAKDLTKSSFTIPAGDYGFEMNKYKSGLTFAYGAAIQDIHRPEDNPFTIYAEGVTFWVEPTGKPLESATYGFLINNCSNIKVVGLTVDEYMTHDVEGYVSQIDKTNNRIAIKLTNSSMPVTDEVIAFAKTKVTRIVPFKASGEHIASLYRIDPNGWGPGAMMVQSLDPTGNENEYWITFQSKLLVQTITDSRWKSTYGSLGTIEEGDVISMLYAQTLLMIVNSKQVTVEGLNNYMTTGIVGEEGGYGNHLWKDCYFGPRPGTTKVMTEGEYMFNATRVGSTLDNVYIASASDDEINIHGYWCEPYNVQGNSMTLRYLHKGLIAGDVAEFYDSNGNLVATRTLASAPEGDTVTFTEKAPANATSLKVHFPALECDGWVIKNCTFMNNYQRILIQTGSGTFENNKIYNMGMNMAVATTYNYLEGGILGDITFRNNVFYNCANSPGTYLFEVVQNNEWNDKILGGNIEISDNLFINCGYAFYGKNLKGLTVKDNIFVEPIVYGETVTKISKLVGSVQYVKEYSFSANTLYSTVASKATDEDGNGGTRISSELASRTAFYATNSDKDATSIIEIIKSNLSKG